MFFSFFFSVKSHHDDTSAVPRGRGRTLLSGTAVLGATRCSGSGTATSSQSTGERRDGGYPSGSPKERLLQEPLPRGRTG